MLLDPFKDVNELIENEQWNEVLRWEQEHHGSDAFVMKKVIECYELCIKQEMSVAYLNLGSIYYCGIFVEQDYKKAYELYKVAANAGHKEAICNIGYCFYYGRHREKDYEKAFEYFSKGALLFDDANCLYKLGDMYLNGYAVEKNEKYAVMLYKRAWEHVHYDNNSNGYADIAFRAGKCYLKDIGIKKNSEKAHLYLTKALLGFYKRRNSDPFIRGLINSTKQMINQVQTELDSETL